MQYNEIILKILLEAQHYNSSLENCDSFTHVPEKETFYHVHWV